MPGKPVIGIRTSTHAFTGNGDFGGGISYGKFGPLIMGEGWVSHHGKHKGEGARGIIETEHAAHPILKGVTDVFGPSDVYGIRRLTEKDTILMRGAVTATLDPDSSFVDAKNDPMQPLAWLHPYEAPTERQEPPSAPLWELRWTWSVRICAVFWSMPPISLPGVKCPNMRALRTSTRFILPFTVSSVTRSIGPPSICSHRIMDWARVPAHPSPRVPLSGITDPDPDFSLKPGGIRLRAFHFYSEFSTPASERSSFASLTDILPLGKANPRVSPLGVKPSPLRSTNMGLL